jgi:ribose transport system substrate-binding protein
MKYKNKIMKKITALAIMCSFVGVASAADYKIGVSVPSADHGWTAGLLWWANKAAKEIGAKEKDVEFFIVAASSGSKQVGDVEDLMIKGIDALVILPHNPNTLQKVIEEAYGEGIYTVVVDRELATPAQNVFIAGDNPGLGRESAIWLAEEMKGKGNLVVIEGMQIPINAQRVDAFNEIMVDFPKIKTLDTQGADWSTQKALAVMENMLQKHPKIDAVWCQDDDMLKGVMQAIKESGRTEIKTVLGGAGSKDIIKMIMDGDKVVRSTVTYNPSMVASAITFAVAGAKGETVGDLYHTPSRVIIGADLVTKDNAKDFYFPSAAF